MNIGGIVHMYAPLHNAGAEWMMHHTLKLLRRSGHTVSVYCPSWPKNGPAEWQGVPILTPTHCTLDKYTEWCNIALTHLDVTRPAMMSCAKTGTPLAHLVHNDAQLGMHGVTPTTCQLAIFNSRWLCAKVSYPGKQAVLTPPCPPSEYRSDQKRSRASRNLLVNVSGAKGSDVFYELARRAPERRFLGVLGAYNLQLIENRSNVDVWPQTPRMRRVYQEARVLLVPSVYESYGRVAIEAGWGRVPCIYHPTLGLVESIGMAGMAADRGSIDQWLGALDELDDPKRYAEMSGRARENAEAAWARSKAQIVHIDRLFHEIAGVEMAA